MDGVLFEEPVYALMCGVWCARISGRWLPCKVGFEVVWCEDEAVLCKDQ